jgi:hypothetical protein
METKIPSRPALINRQTTETVVSSTDVCSKGTSGPLGLLSRKEMERKEIDNFIRVDPIKNETRKFDVKSGTTGNNIEG